jgi:hypothetical protein
MHPDGTDERRVTDGKGLNCYPRFAPNGKQLVYSSLRNKESSICIVDIDGQNRRKVYAEHDLGKGCPEGACWSPDGKWLAIPLFDWEIDEKGEKFRRAGADNDYRLLVIGADGRNQRLVDLRGEPSIRFLGKAEWK